MAWIERQRYCIDFALSSLMRQWKKNLALTAVYTLVVFFLSSVLFFTQAIRREASIVLEGSPDIVVQRLVAGRQDLIPARCMEQLRKITGVTDVRGRLWAYYFDAATSANYTIIATEKPAPEQGFLIMGQGVARAFKAGRGDLVALRGYDGSYRSFEVRDTFSSTSELVSADLIELSQEDFRSLFGIRETQYTDISLKAGNARERIVIARKIQRLFPDLRPILKDEILRTYEAAFAWRSGILLVILSGAVFAFLILAWDKATSLSMEERKEIGILKAIGWNTGEVIAMKSWEGLIISLSSFLAGITLAYVHVFFASSSIFEPVLKGWAVIYPRFSLLPALDPCQIAALLFLTVIPYTVATIIPSWLASTIEPDSAMRF